MLHFQVSCQIQVSTSSVLFAAFIIFFDYSNVSSHLDTDEWGCANCVKAVSACSVGWFRFRWLNRFVVLPHEMPTIVR